jgi:superfamily II DNA or RNA helicase
MVNTTYPELQETQAQSLPPAELHILKTMRAEFCSDSKKKDYKLQPQQRFLRRILSPDNPTQNLLMVHGTGTGKTCTAIQIAEEYVIRPEFQNKKVLMLANPSVQDNFKNEIFSVSDDKLYQDPDGLLLSKQCTGRRYLEIIQRAQSEPLRLTDSSVRDKIRRMADSLLREFYEFQGYDGFANYVSRNVEGKTQNDINKWVHDTFDDRLIIVDEAHNLRVTTETTSTAKISAKAIESIVKQAKGVTLVLLTATPMFDDYDEIIYYFNLFLWNDKRLDSSKSITVSEIFEKDGSFKEGQEVRFRGWCQDYISYIKGENPFTFPFRLPPSENLVAPIDRTISHLGDPIDKPRKYLTLTKSLVSPYQEKIIKNLPIRIGGNGPLICTYPENKSFSEIFGRSDEQYEYRKGFDKFLAPSKVALYSSKFALILNILENSNGIAFVYSNLVENGANLFAMCLEEHGFENAIKSNFLKNPSGEIAKGSKGKYVIFTGESSRAEIENALRRLKDRKNIAGNDIRVIIASEKVSEGVDFKYVRQVHVLDPWFNMSRVEQVLGRGMRTCSHSLLPFEQQNCTVYLHICRYPDDTKESADEYIYREFVENKAVRIASIKRVIMESAMDCNLQQGINNLPEDWRSLSIPQIRSQDKKELNLSLLQMSAPTFEDTVTDLVCRTQSMTPDNEHVRPLSAILDIRDEVFDKLLKLFLRKPVWSMKDLFSHSSMKQYNKDVLEYLIQNAIESQLEIKNNFGRIGKLKSKDSVITLEFQENDTLVEKLIPESKGTATPIPESAVIEEDVKEVEDVDIVSKRNAFDWPIFARDFENDVLDWYIVDNILTPVERQKHLLNLDWSTPPIYAKDLVTTMKNKKAMYILGSKQIYNDEKKLITPIGEERDIYNRWLASQKESFIEKKDTLYVSMKFDPRSIVFTIDEKSTQIKKAPRTKSFAGRACLSYTGPVLNAFLTWLTGDDAFPESVKSNKDKCMYIDLVVRRAIIQNNEKLFWLPPEILEIFDREDENRKDLLRRLK